MTVSQSHDWETVMGERKKIVIKKSADWCSACEVRGSSGPGNVERVGERVRWIRVSSRGNRGKMAAHSRAR